MNSIIIGGRTIPLFYSVLETVEIEKSIGCTAFQLNEKIMDARKVNEDEDDPEKIEMRFGLIDKPENKENLGKLIRILGNAGLEENGEAADLTDRWVMRNMKPGMIMIYAMAVMAVINEGNSLEAADRREGPVDELLEEEQGKKLQGS